MRKITFEISDEAFELLAKIGNGSAEYRDNEYPSIKEFKESHEFKEGLRSEQWFFNRNFGGTYYLIEELLNYGLVESDGCSWHITYVLTELGKKSLK